jgi:hypothetical protein
MQDVRALDAIDAVIAVALAQPQRALLPGSGDPGPC